MSVSPFHARFQDSVESWSGLHGSSVALAIHAAAADFAGVTVVVTRSSHQAQVLHRDLELLAVNALPIHLFPDHETLPYDPFSPHPDIISERLKTLSSLSVLRQGIVLAPVTSLIQRLPPAEYILQRSFDLTPGQPLVIDEFRRQLHHSGYESSEQVYQAGQYAIRGSVVDLFPAGSSTPYRLDLFDEEIDTIREFDPESQRSTGKVSRIDLLPAREYPCDEAALENFRRAFRMRFDVRYTKRNPVPGSSLRSSSAGTGTIPAVVLRRDFLPVRLPGHATAPGVATRVSRSRRNAHGANHGTLGAKEARCRKACAGSMGTVFHA